LAKYLLISARLAALVVGPMERTFSSGSLGKEEEEEEEEEDDENELICWKMMRRREGKDIDEIT